RLACLKPEERASALVPPLTVASALLGGQLFHRTRARGLENGKEVQMEPNDMGGSLPRHLSGDLGAPVPALNAVSRVAEAIHQDDEGFCHPHRAPASSRRRPGEREAGKRGDDDVKSRCMAVLRMRERLDHTQELGERARPSMNQHQRYGIRPW